MTNYWIFQSNPDRYDIDAALRDLDVILWRVPQHTAEIRPGDKVAVWRSGPEAGIVGGGTITEAPRERELSPAEARFTHDPQQEVQSGLATRVALRVQPVSFVSKEDLKQELKLREHQILVAPMGTVFPVTRDEWEALERLSPDLDSLPYLEVPDQEKWPQPFSWKDRRKSVYPLPGGYNHYLDSLRKILTHLEDVRPEREHLHSWIHESLGTSLTSARNAVAFLERVSLLKARAGEVEATPEARYWLSSGNPGYFIALMHSRVRLIGELLQLLEDRPTSEELLELANDLYGMGWKSRAQIDRRRGWLESAGAIETDDQGRWTLTDQGHSILNRMRVEPPREFPTSDNLEEETDQDDDGTEATERDPELEQAIRLERVLRTAAADTSDPDSFEKAAAEAFAFLGFQSSWLGGSGRTDVLLVAELSSDETYRVIVDCKTTSHEAVRDQQIDWATLREHHRQHQADYIVVMGPAFAGGRIVERAHAPEWRTVLLDVDTMGALLRQHARIPLDLATYRQFFEAETAEQGAALLGEEADEWDRRFQLSARIVELVATNESPQGALGPRDLYWLLQGYSDEVGTYTEEEIGESLDALASPTIGVLRRSDGGFLGLGSARTAGKRLRQLASLIEARAEKDGS